MSRGVKAKSARQTGLNIVPFTPLSNSSSILAPWFFLILDLIDRNHLPLSSCDELAKQPGLRFFADLRCHSGNDGPFAVEPEFTSNS
jgi:hypothetical protein